MATQTLTDTADFGAIEHCSIESGSVKVGKYNFSTDDTGTGGDDWSGDVDVATNAGFLTFNPPIPASAINVDYATVSTTPTGDFSMTTKVIIDQWSDFSHAEISAYTGAPDGTAPGASFVAVTRHNHPTIPSNYLRFRYFSGGNTQYEDPLEVSATTNMVGRGCG